ncbi:MAG: PEP-CTERM sorting domain-containing protein [Verrucomicrobia bacterium]|nr:PEP-CTERM sorting domain-containing protein [Verrucomicrobiota bacterium]
MKRRTLLPLVAALFAFALAGKAQTVVYTWTGLGQYADWTYSYNWQGGLVPASDLVNTQVVFGDTLHTAVYYYDAYVNKLTISGNTRAWNVVGDSSTTHIGNGGIVYNPSGSVTSTLFGRVMLEANQTWNIQGGTFVVNDSILENVGPFTITKTGAGTLELVDSSNSTWTGGINLNAGTLTIRALYGSNSAVLGTGALTFNGGTLKTVQNPNDSSADSVTITNDIVSNGLLSFVNKVDLYLQTNGTSHVTLNADTTLDSHGKPTWFESGIVESSPGLKLTVTGPGWVIFDAPTGYTGGTVANNGALIFTTINTLPTAPVANAFTVGANGYIGLGDDSTGTYNLQSTFIDRFNKAATLGTVGLDTDPSLSSPTVWTDPIDLTGFAATARLGSATSASIAGTITPQGSDYRFGGGGGWLEVSSILTGARNLVVDSPSGYPLTLHLTGGNDYTGTTTVTNSAVVFSDISLPTGSRLVSIGAGGYVGTESANSGSDTPDDADIATFLGNITLSSTGMIGFDGSYRTLARPIDLSAFTGTLYLGTASLGYAGDGVNAALTLTGPITTTNGGNDPYRFAAYKGGVLEVDSTLTGSHGVVIGDPNSPATFGDYSRQMYSTVYLNGDNGALTGNVTFYAGQLFVGQVNGVQGVDPTTALGTGTLVVQPMTLPTGWTDTSNKIFPLLATIYDTIIANPIQLNTTLTRSAETAGVTFTGKISGTGGLYLENPSWGGIFTTLSNDLNDFTGGVYVEGGSTLNLDANHALGLGTLSFGNSTGDVYFGTTAPVIYGLETTQPNDSPILYSTQIDTVLTIDQSFDSTFQGTFASTLNPVDNFRLVKTGTGTLNLVSGGMYFYNGTAEPTLPGSPAVWMQVNQGELVIGQQFQFGTGTPTIWVHGGSLVLSNYNYYSIVNPIVVDNSGRLAGTGSLNGLTTIASGGILSPGLYGSADLGALYFNNLTLKGGGTMEWNLINPTAGAGDGWDAAFVSGQLTVDSSVTAGTPFTLKLISLGPTGALGAVTGFADGTYSWTLFDGGTNPIVFGGGSFDPNAFVIDSSSFSTDFGTGTGYFTFSQNGNALQLNFVPVPEPSTYALLALGLGLFAKGLRKRRT